MSPEFLRDIDDLLDMGERPSLSDFERRRVLRRFCAAAETASHADPESCKDVDDGPPAAARRELADLESRLDFL